MIAIRERRRKPREAKRQSMTERWNKYDPSAARSHSKPVRGKVAHEANIKLNKLGPFAGDIPWFLFRECRLHEAACVKWYEPFAMR
jgi:hypothetical protein